MYTTLGCIHNAEFKELVTQSISITGTGNHTALDTKQSCSSREMKGSNQVDARHVYNIDPAVGKPSRRSSDPAFYIDPSASGRSDGECDFLETNAFFSVHLESMFPIF
jgi:hypothetical protein